VKELIARNFGLISPEIQEKIGKARILFVGCGLGNQIAVLAARTGFTHFELWDGDRIELSNLNRQAFSRADVGLNKAEVTTRLLKAINPELEVEIWPHFLHTQEEIITAIEKTDLVVNTADAPETVWIDEISAEKGVPHFFPMNVGFGGFVLVFTPNSQRLKEMGEGKILSSNEFFSQVLQTAIPYLSESFRGELERFRDIEKEIPPVPQLGIAAYLASALVVAAMIRWVTGDLTLPVAPQPLWLCSWM